MITLPQYTITDKIHSGAETVVYRGYRNVDRAAVAIKLFTSEYPSSRQIAKLRHEYTITRDLDVSGVVKAYGLERVGTNLALVTESLEERPLSDVLLTQALDLKTSLRIAASIADTLEAIHRRNIIHKDIKPQNVLVRLETCEAKLIDFGVATRLSQEVQRARSPDCLEGTLTYMSPEQTGRMNRALDHRTDLYSLGVTLYEMLTGAPPFQATDPLELLHSHIAKKPAPPHERSPAVPEAVSNIVMKLLAKAAEDRYQSAHGLRADLHECLAQLQATGRITPFPLGRHDRGHGLLIPQKLYGRDEEIAALVSAWDRASRGAAELVLISGHAGIGKSVIVNELYKVVAGRRAYFIAGKFDQFNRSVPYASLAQAFRDLIRHLLTERDEALARFRRQLTAAVGQSGQVLVDLMPELELVLGRQPPVPELGSTEAQNRFNLVFQNFLRVFTTADHPLVLFLDDLQWADLASLRLLTQLLSDPERGHLLVIGAYRDNEVDASHPLSAAQADIRKAGTNAVEIRLEPLRLLDVNQLLSDALGCDKQRSAPLAQLVLDKTQGNPFFINQFLVSLYKDQLITFDGPSGSFCWDLERIRKAAITDNVVDFMAKKLRRLSPGTQQILTLAACIGHQFDLRTLAMIDERSPVDTAADLWEALHENVVLPLDSEYRFLHVELDPSGAGDLPPRDINVSYRFLHDRVQQAAYSLIDDEHKQELHLRIGRLMLAQRALGENDERLFDTVNHLNRGASRIASSDERARLARLNLTAGRKAKASAAYDVAASYFGAGASLLREAGWEQEHELTFALHLERAGSEFLSGRFAQAESLFDVVLARAKENLARAHVHAQRILLFNTVAKFAEGVTSARTALALLGIELPEGEDRIQAALAAELAEVPRNLAGRRITDLLHAPELTDPVQKAAQTILTNVNASLLTSCPSLHAFACVKQANISLKHGHSDASAYSYLTYAHVLIGLGRYEEAYEFGKLAMELNETMSCADLSSKVKSSFAVFIAPYREPLRLSLFYLAQAHQEGLEVGDFQFASYSVMHGITNRLSHGDELGAIAEEIEASIPFLQRTKEMVSTTVVLSVKQIIASLRGRTLGRHTLDDGSFDEVELDAKLRAAGYEFMAAFYHIHRAELAFLYEDHEHALSRVTQAVPLRPYLANMWISTEVPFYASLIALALYPTSTAAERARHDAELARYAAELAVWAESCPENFRHKLLLVSSERARVSGDDTTAMDLYEQAIHAAHESGFLHHEALANELSARFHLAKGRTKIARTYMIDALYGYARWGAEAKVAQLKEKYPELLPRGAEGAKPAGPMQTTTLSGGGDALDLASVVKASQAVSGEIELGKLFERLMRTAMENAGANKGYLLLTSDEELYVEAAADAEAPARSVLLSVPLNDVDDLSHAVVRYVQKTKERVVLANAARESMFLLDPYMARKKPKSILCAPIVQQGNLIGVLYLENNLVAGAFTPDRLTALSLLATQAAISLKNARLLANEQAARAAAEAAERRAAFLAEAGEILSGSLDYAETLSRLAKLSVRSLCDWCVIDILEGESGEPRRVGWAHRDPAKEPLLEELQRRYPPRRDSPQPAGRVLRGGEPILCTELPEELLRQHSVDDGHLRIVRALGVCSSMTVPLVARGQTIGTLGVVSSVPARRYGAADLELLQEVARRAAIAIDNARLYRAAQEAVRTRDEFLTVAAHELNTPMTSLTLSLEGLHRTLRSGRPADPQAMDRQIERALRQAARLTRLNNELLDVSRIHADRLSVDVEEVDLRSVVRDVIARFKLDLARAGCSVSLRDSGRLVGRWDRSRVDQIVTNLLANAIKFGAGKPVEISLCEEAGAARLSVRDHGIGVDPACQAQIFERFERAVSDRHYGGLGLGLYISRRIAEAHGGSIRVESALGAGATFIVELPRAGPG